MNSVSLWVVVMIGLGALYLYLAVGSGFHATDAITLWGAKGLGIASEGLKAVGTWGTITTNYPLHIPLLIGIFDAAYGGVLPAAKVVFPAYYLALLLMLFGFLEERIGRNRAGLSVLVFGSSPMIVHHARIGYANLPLTFYVCGSAILLTGVISRPSPKKGQNGWWMPLLFMVLSVWTRPEGIWVGLGVWLSLLAFHNWGSRGDHQGRLTWMVVLGPVLFWVFWKVTSRPFALEESVESLASVAANSIWMGDFQLHSLWDIAGFLGRQIVRVRSWGWVGAGMILVILDRIRDKRPLEMPTKGLMLSGLGGVAVVMGMYYVFAFDPLHDIQWWLGSGFNRMAMPGMALLWTSICMGLFPIRKPAVP